jgi:hypothetical protein
MGKPEREDKKQVNNQGSSSGGDGNAIENKSESRDPELYDPTNIHSGPEKDKAEVKPWGEMSKEDRRAEAWREFKDNFSWEEVFEELLKMVGIMVLALGLSAAPLIGPAVMPILGGLAIAMGLWTIIAPFLDGKSPTVVEWLKGGLLILGGAALIVAAVATSPGWAPIAGGIAMTAFILYAVVEALNSYLLFEDAVAAPTREEMKVKAKESAKEAQNTVRDFSSFFIPAGKAQKAIQKLVKTKVKPGAPAEEALPTSEEPGGFEGSSADEQLPKQVEESLGVKEEELIVGEELEGAGFKNLLGLRAIERIKIRFKPNAAHDQVEFARQMKAQEDGLNKLTVEEYIANRDRYLREGRSKDADRAQAEYRERALEKKVNELLEEDPDISLDDATTKAKKWLDTQAVLHDPDQVTGGNPTNIGGLGDKRVNSSIGSQWSKREAGSTLTRAESIDKAVRDASRGMTPEEMSKTYLNISIAW